MIGFFQVILVQLEVFAPANGQSRPPHSIPIQPRHQGVHPFATGIFSGDLAADQLTYRG